MPIKLNLGAKYSAFLLLVFVAGSVVGGIALSKALESIAEASVTSEDNVLMQTIDSVRAYTDSQVKPELSAMQASRQSFIPQTVPAYSARVVFQNLRSMPQYSQYQYKEAADNPTNPSDKADPFEEALLQTLRSDPQTSEVSGFRSVGSSVYYYVARPMSVTGQDCLQCHSTPANAPQAMVAQYGTENGFGWHLGQVIAVQIMYVPADQVYGLARRTLLLIGLLTAAVFAVAVLVINLLLRRDVIWPLQRIAETARDVEAGSFDEAVPARLTGLSTRSDELGRLSRVFQAMARQVLTREASLRQRVQELQIVIDEAKKVQQVAEVVGTEYFQELRQKAQQMRARKTLNEVEPNQPASDD